MHFLTEPPAALRMGLGVSIREAGPKAAAKRARDILSQLPTQHITRLREQGFDTIDDPRHQSDDEWSGGG